jgi:hypothetical protein
VAENEGRLSNPVRHSGDNWPCAAELLLELRHFVRHPRSYLRNLAKSQPLSVGKEAPLEIISRTSMRQPKLARDTRAAYRKEMSGHPPQTP